MGKGLDDESVCASDTFSKFHQGLSIPESIDPGSAQGNSKVITDLLCQLWIAVTTHDS
jgi:hypothetical protein